MELPQIARLGRMHIHAMHHTTTASVGCGCTDVHKSAKYVTLYDANRTARAPAINYKITIATILGRTITTNYGS